MSSSSHLNQNINYQPVNHDPNTIMPQQQQQQQQMPFNYPVEEQNFVKVPVMMNNPNFPGAPPHVFQTSEQIYYAPPPPSPSPPSPSPPTQVYFTQAGAASQVDVEALKEYILQRSYEVKIGEWIREGWNLYKQMWWGYSLLLAAMIVISFIPDVGGLLAWPLSIGFFTAPANSLRLGEAPKFSHLFLGYLYYIPMFIISLVYGLASGVGLMLLIVPGIWAMVALSFANFIYLEYHDCGIRVFDSFVLSSKVVNKNFFQVLLYLLAVWLFSLSGVLLLGVGLFVTIPVGSISFVLAFNDMFGLNRAHRFNNACVCAV